jgi:hypothetical protein
MYTPYNSANIKSYTPMTTLTRREIWNKGNVQLFVNRQTSGESASLPQYDEGTESVEVATSETKRLHWDGRMNGS